MRGLSVKMEQNLRNGLVLAVTVVLLQAAAVSGLSCYKCTILPPPPNSSETTRLCSHFDGSSKYVVDCPFSTFCMKKTFELPLQKGLTVRGVQRDCAAQHYTYQTLVDSRWVNQDAIVDSAYDEGCHQEDKGVTQSVKSASATYCYCKKNLCNTAKAAREPTAAHHTDAMAVIFVFNAMKYIRSLR
ncbi:uncharacterized protein [Anabrus simplex]|uniref:uncharacterized protein n=1 Tax=Anabrus simplex TaxID=316456 RepID=UPI0034DD3502